MHHANKTRAEGLIDPCQSDAGLQAVPPLVEEHEDLEEDEDLKQQQVLEGLPWGFTITSKARQEWTNMDPPNRSAWLLCAVRSSNNVMPCAVTIVSCPGTLPKHQCCRFDAEIVMNAG